MTLLEKLDILSAKLLREGRMPNPDLLVLALLAADGNNPGESVVKLARVPLTPEHVIYVSPSQREGSTYAEAMRNLHSQDMIRLANEAALLPSVRGSTPGYGYWKDGAEESQIVNVGDPAYVQHIAATLGQLFRQKGVLSFSESPTGSDARHVIVVADTDPVKIHADMMRHGIEYKTIIPISGGSRVEAVDVGDSMRPEFSAYAAEAGAKSHQIRSGSASYIGADTRDEARREYDKVLRLARPKKTKAAAAKSVEQVANPQGSLPPSAPPTYRSPERVHRHGELLTGLGAFPNQKRVATKVPRTVNQYRVADYEPMWNGHAGEWQWIHAEEVGNVPRELLNTLNIHHLHDRTAPGQDERGYNNTPLTEYERMVYGIDPPSAEAVGGTPEQIERDMGRPSSTIPEDFYM